MQLLSQIVWFFCDDYTDIYPAFCPEADMFNYARYFDTFWKRVYGFDIWYTQPDFTFTAVYASRVSLG